MGETPVYRPQYGCPAWRMRLSYSTVNPIRPGHPAIISGAQKVVSKYWSLEGVAFVAREQRVRVTNLEDCFLFVVRLYAR